MHALTQRLRDRAWRVAAARHGLTYTAQTDPPSGAGAPYHRGVQRQLTQVLTGPVPATVAFPGPPGSAGVRPVTVTVATFATLLPMPGSRGAARARFSVIEAQLPAALPALTVADAPYAAAFGVGPATAAALTGHRELHARFTVATAHPGFARAALATAAPAALDLPEPSHLTIDGAVARLVTEAAPTPQVALAHLDRLCAVVEALPAAVWRVAGLPVPAPAAPAAGWERGLPSARPTPVPYGPAWR